MFASFLLWSKERKSNRIIDKDNLKIENKMALTAQKAQLEQKMALTLIWNNMGTIDSIHKKHVQIVHAPPIFR